MLYLLHTHWLWFFGAVALGVIVGWLTYLRAATAWTDRPVHIALGAVALGAIVAAAKVVPGRYGYWLEFGVMFAVFYAAGCFIGWALRDLAEYMPAAAKTGAGATAGTGSYLFRDAHAGLATGDAYMRTAPSDGALVRTRLPLPAASAGFDKAPVAGGYTFPATQRFADATTSRPATGPVPGLRRHWSWPRAEGAAPFVFKEFAGEKGGYVFPAAAPESPHAKIAREGATAGGHYKHWSWRAAGPVETLAASALATKATTAASGAATAAATGASQIVGRAAKSEFAGSKGGYVFPAVAAAAAPLATRDGKTRGGLYRHWSWRGADAALAPAAGAVTAPGSSASPVAAAGLPHAPIAPPPASTPTPAPATAGAGVTSASPVTTASPTLAATATPATGGATADAPVTPIAAPAGPSPTAAGAGGTIATPVTTTSPSPAATAAVPTTSRAAASSGASSGSESASIAPASAAAPPPSPAAAGTGALDSGDATRRPGAAPAPSPAVVASAPPVAQASEPAPVAPSAGAETPAVALVPASAAAISAGPGVSGASDVPTPPPTPAPVETSAGDATAGSQQSAGAPAATTASVSPTIDRPGAAAVASGVVDAKPEAQSAAVGSAAGAPTGDLAAPPPSPPSNGDTAPMATTTAGLPAAPPAAPGQPPVIAAVPNEDKHPGERPEGLMTARDDRADDLKRIRGIGPQNEGRLHGLGIWHFDQIGAWTPENVRWVGSYLAFPGRIDRETWVAQAKVLASGGDTEFSKRVRAGKVATKPDDGTLGQTNIADISGGPRKPR